MAAPGDGPGVPTTTTVDAPALVDHPDVRGCPPSAKYVAYVLEHHGPLTQRQLAATTGLPERTTRYALERLDEVSDLLVAEPYLADLRKKQYDIPTPRDP